MSMRRFIVTSLNSRRGFGFAQEQSSAGTILDQQPIFFHFKDVSTVTYDTCYGEFEFTRHQGYPLNPVQVVNFRPPQVGDELMAELDQDSQGRDRLMTWTYLVHFNEVDAKQPRCEKTGCTIKLSDQDDSGFCFKHDPRDIEEDDDYVSIGEILSRATAYFGHTEEAYEAARQCPGDFM